MSVTAVETGPVRQKTLANPIHCRGVGLHNGRQVTLTLMPAPADTGILFHRTDISPIPAGPALIPALWDQVVDTRMCTCIANDAGVRVNTIEHLMAALAGCGVDNVLIALDADEVPILDGSAAPFAFLIEAAGTVAQPAVREVIEVLRPVAVGDGTRAAGLAPAAGFEIEVEIVYGADTPIGRQSRRLDITPETFRAELARARTYGFAHEVEALRAAGLARGGSLDNAVVVSGDRILNDGGLRYRDEFVRHKMLDCVGDLALAGAPLIGRFTGARSGHEMNNRILAALFADPANWRRVPQRPQHRGGGWSDRKVAAASA